MAILPVLVHFPAKPVAPRRLAKAAPKDVRNMTLFDRGGSGAGEAETVLRRNNVNVSGRGARAMMFSHGFGCDQNMWTTVARDFEAKFRTILFDHVGAGRSDLGAYDAAKYSRLEGYADDVVEIGNALALQDAVFVGHSVSAMIGALASLKAPGMFSDLVMVGPSPRYVDDGAYVGGFSQGQVEELLEFLADNHLGWSAAMAPAIMGNADRPELGEALANSFCATDPEIARQFARVTFFSDNRADLPRIAARTLVLQCREDIIAPPCVGEYVHAQVPNSEYVLLDATGHCPNLSAPKEVTAAIRAFV
jgi:sigma-B regulation protein RsbQ